MKLGFRHASAPRGEVADLDLRRPRRENYAARQRALFFVTFQRWKVTKDRRGAGTAFRFAPIADERSESAK